MKHHMVPNSFQCTKCGLHVQHFTAECVGVKLSARTLKHRAEGKIDYYNGEWHYLTPDVQTKMYEDEDINEAFDRAVHGPRFRNTTTGRAQSNPKPTKQEVVGSDSNDEVKAIHAFFDMLGETSDVMQENVKEDSRVNSMLHNTSLGNFDVKVTSLSEGQAAVIQMLKDIFMQDEEEDNSLTEDEIDMLKQILILPIPVAHVTGLELTDDEYPILARLKSLGLVQLANGYYFTTEAGYNYVNSDEPEEEEPTPNEMIKELAEALGLKVVDLSLTEPEDLPAICSYDEIQLLLSMYRGSRKFSATEHGLSQMLTVLSLHEKGLLDSIGREDGSTCITAQGKAYVQKLLAVTYE